MTLEGARFELSPPTERAHRSFLAAMAEFRAEGRGAATDATMIGAEIREYGSIWATPDGFREYLAWLHGQDREYVHRPRGYLPVPSTTLWWVRGAEYLGRIAIRHRLTTKLRDVGGHIGFDVRPSARRCGHATAMLRSALPVARTLGIDRALVTCDAGNVGSRRVIEANGGVLEDQRGNSLRFWLPVP
ncbi:MAG TPA: GNAT family N-acetyltransferase [Micromonosporaceae bacterium]|nr:GNAT family N-acetyltransferase [Micromonosporaceae bacterium]